VAASRLPAAEAALNLFHIISLNPPTQFFLIFYILALHCAHFPGSKEHADELYLKKLMVRVPGYTTELYCVSCEVQTEFIYVMKKKVDRLCGLEVRVPGYTTEMYCVCCEVRTEFIYVM
jgi:hypothetical protein